MVTPRDVGVRLVRVCDCYNGFELDTQTADPDGWQTWDEMIAEVGVSDEDQKDLYWVLSIDGDEVEMPKDAQDVKADHAYLLRFCWYNDRGYDYDLWPTMVWTLENGEMYALVYGDYDEL